MQDLRHFVPGPFRLSSSVQVTNAETMRVFGGVPACAFDALPSILQFEVR